MKQIYLRSISHFISVISLRPLQASYRKIPDKSSLRFSRNWRREITYRTQAIHFMSRSRHALTICEWPLLFNCLSTYQNTCIWLFLRLLRGNLRYIHFVLFVVCCLVWPPLAHVVSGIQNEAHSISSCCCCFRTSWRHLMERFWRSNVLL